MGADLSCKHMDALDIQIIKVTQGNKYFTIINYAGGDNMHTVDQNSIKSWHPLASNHVTNDKPAHRA